MLRSLHDRFAPLQVRLTRESVAMGDDIWAPHEREMTLEPGMSLIGVIASVARSGYLAGIQGGHATWVAISGQPLAVVAQEWPAPRSLPGAPHEVRDGRLDGDVLLLHFAYRAQEDPEVVYRLLATNP